ncbi:MAG: hypothetical protein K2H85_11760, partial [Allobaculum sp.]|nr:hypothetical protein [Allobaculum sp.]
NIIMEDGYETLKLGLNSQAGLFSDTQLECVHLSRNLSYETSPFANTSITSITFGKGPMK